MKLATQILLGFLIAISIDLMDSYVNYRLTLQVKKNLDFLDRSETVIRQSNALNERILQMQASFRGFLLTGDETYLERYSGGKTAVPGMMAAERSLVQLAGERAVLDSVALLYGQWVLNSDTLIAIKRSSGGVRGDPEQQALLDTRFRHTRQQRYNTRLADLFSALETSEYEQRNTRRAKLVAATRRTDTYSFLFSAFLVLAAFAIAYYLMRLISRRIQSMVRLADKIAKGDFQPVTDQRHDELTDLSVSLNSMSEQLSRNIGELEKRNRELSQFAYVVSHDLKAPVRGISNVVGWIREDLAGEISPAMQKYLDYIPDRVRRMEDLIDGLLAYGRAGRDSSPAEPVDVAGLIGEIAEYMVPRRQVFRVGPMPVIHTQRLPLQQVFSNLIGNAVKYAPQDGGEISIVCTDREGFYEFAVEDNGPGIAAEYHEKVFGLFQTLREKADKESTGIGLAIVRKIVQEHGGMVKIKSVPGSGASFIFTWPKGSA